MSTVIRADTDQLRTVARQMRATADQITSGSNGMNQSMQALDATWGGSAHDRGMARWAEITPKYPPAVERLEHFANELEALAQRLDDAAAVFGGGGDRSIGIGTHIGVHGGLTDGSDKSTNTPSGVPKDLHELFNIIHSKDDSRRIKVFQVGPNNYVITLDGVNLSDPLSGSNNALNGFLSVGGLDSSYTRQLRETLRKLPPSAKVDLFGYSLGGIVSHNTVDDADFMQEMKNRGVTINSINSIGSPPPLTRVPGILYRDQEFDALGDPVTKLAPTITVDWPRVHVNPESAQSIDVFNLSNGLNLHTEGYSDINRQGGTLAKPTLGELLGPMDRWQERSDLAVNRDGVIETFTGIVTENSPKEVVDAVGNYTSLVIDTGINLTTKGIETAEDIGEQVVDTASNVVASSINAANDGLNVIKGTGSSAISGMKNLFNW